MNSEIQSEITSELQRGRMLGAILRHSPAAKLDLLIEITLGYFADNRGIIEGRTIREIAATAKMTRRNTFLCLARLQRAGRVVILTESGRPSRYALAAAREIATVRETGDKSGDISASG